MAADPPALSANERLRQQRAIRGRVGDNAVALVGAVDVVVKHGPCVGRSCAPALRPGVAACRPLEERATSRFRRYPDVAIEHLGPRGAQSDAPWTETSATVQERRTARPGLVCEARALDRSAPALVGFRYAGDQESALQAGDCGSVSR